MATKKAPTDRAPAAKKPAKKKPAGPQGNLKPDSRQKLAINARQAFDYQRDLGNIEDGVTFNDWRHDQVMEVVGKPGISACNGGDFRPVMAHFLALAGKDAEAFRQHMQTGPVKDSSPADDTHEAREQWLALLRAEIASHVALGELGEVNVPIEALDYWRAIRAAGGPIRNGYACAIASNKFGIFKTGFDQLHTRLTAKQLEQLFYTVRNRILSREGRPETKKGRNRLQRSQAGKDARKEAVDSGTLTPRPIPGLDSNEPF